MGQASSTYCWFENWPPSELLLRFNESTCHEQGVREAGAGEKGEVQNITVNQLLSLEHLVQKWAPVILHNINDLDRRETVECDLTEAVELLRGIHGQHRTDISRQLRHSSGRLLAAIDMACMIKANAKGLRSVCEKALSMLHPCLTSLLQTRLPALPSPSTVQRHMLSLDMSMLMLQKYVDQKYPVACRYGFMDSSPLGGYDWMWCKHTMMDCGEPGGLLSFFHKVKKAHFALLQAFGEMEQEELQRDLAAVAEEAPFLQHTHLPICMGSGFSGVAHKMAGLLQCFCLERPKQEDLVAFINGFVSFTTDMGTEIGLSNFKGNSLRDLLPTWALAPGDQSLQDDVRKGPRHYQFEVVDDDGLEADVLRGAPPSRNVTSDAQAPWSGGAQSNFIFQHVLMIPGTLHIIHNMTHELHNIIPNWSLLWKSLKNFEHLLAVRHRRERYLATCVVGISISQDADLAMLKSWSTRLYDKRWGCTVDFIRELLLVWPVLLRTWDVVRYKSHVDTAKISNAPAPLTEKEEEGAEDMEEQSEEGDFKPSMLAADLRDPGFVLILNVVVKVAGIVQKLAIWSESCPCHGKELHSVLDHQGESVRHGHGPCFLKACRGPEFAADVLPQVLQKIVEQDLSDVLTYHTSHVKSEDIKHAQDILSIVKNHLLLLLEVKFGFWRRLPHVLVGMAHSDPDLARGCAALSLQLFDELPEQPAHHHLTWWFCHDHRSEMDKFVGGVPLQELPHVFQLRVASLAFVPVSERSIEAAHAVAKHSWLRRGLQGAPLYFSLANRLPDLHKLLAKHPEFTDSLLHCFDILRRHKEAIGHLGLDRHPTLQDALAHCKHTSHISQLLRSLLYRADIYSQTRSLLTEMSSHEDCWNLGTQINYYPDDMGQIQHIDTDIRPLLLFVSQSLLQP